MIMNVEYSKIKKAVSYFIILICIQFGYRQLKLISVAIADDLNISVTTVSQATLAGLVIGIGAVVYASLSDAISIRTLFILWRDINHYRINYYYIFQHQFALLLVDVLFKL